MKPNRIKNSNLLSILYGNPSKNIKKYNLPIRKSCKPQLARENFENCFHCDSKNSNILYQRQKTKNYTWGILPEGTH